MKTRPKVLLLIAALLFSAALSIPLQIMLLYEHPISELFLVLEKMSVWNWLVVASCLFCGFKALNAAPMIKWIAPASIAMVALNNWMVVSVGQDFSRIQGMLALVAFAKIHALWMHPLARQALSKPQLRWWLIAPRKKINASIVLRTPFGECLTAKLYNLSSTGIFVQFANGDSELISRLKAGQIVDLRILSGPLRQVNCGAEVARIASAKGAHPAGIGLRFVRCPHDARKEIERLAA
jgi:hypothetical protein